MLLTQIYIKNFRGIEELTVPLEPCTVLIGENNTGKTSVLEAIHICLSRNLSRKGIPFNEYDFHLSQAQPEPSTAPPIEIRLTFQESELNEWPDAVVQGLDKAIQFLPDNRQEVRLKVIVAYDQTLKDFALEWAFLDQNNNDLVAARNLKLIAELQQFIPGFFLAAVRDAGQHFQSRSPFWGPFTKNPQLDEETRLELERQIEEINRLVLDAHLPFNEVKRQVAKTGDLVPLGDTDVVTVEAVPARIFDILSKTQVKLASKSGARLPILQHGAGTQSLAVLFLFEAFLNARLADTYDVDSFPLLTLEEPESHLHPSAVRSLWGIIESLKGQKIIATHSGELLATVPLKSIRRLARKGGKVQVFQVRPATLTPDDERKIAYHVRVKRGNLLFARSWLLVEGETEFWFLPEAARLLGYDFELHGICCIEFAQCGLAPLIKLAIDLGIEWHVLVDGDPAGQRYATTVQTFIGTASPSQRLTVLAQPDIEHLMWDHGYSHVYDGAVGAPQRTNIVATPGTPDHTKQTIKMAISSTSKPHLAIAVIEDAKQSALPGALPLPIHQVVTTAVQNAQV